MQTDADVLHTTPHQPQRLSRPAATPGCLQTDNNPLAKWNRKLVGRVDWLHMSPSKAPMLSVLSDRSTIFEGEGGVLAGQGSPLTAAATQPSQKPPHLPLPARVPPPSVQK